MTAEQKVLRDREWLDRRIVEQALLMAGWTEINFVNGPAHGLPPHWKDTSLKPIEAPRVLESVDACIETYGLRKLDARERVRFAGHLKRVMSADKAALNDDRSVSLWLATGRHYTRAWLGFNDVGI